MAKKAATPATITLKHLAAAIAEDQELSKKPAEAILTDMVAMITKHLKKGERIRIVGLGILQVRKRAARMGRNPATGEADPDQGQQEGRLPRRQGTQGSRLSRRSLRPDQKRHSGGAPEWRFSVIERFPGSILLRIVMPASPLAFTHDVTERFLRYVVIDTQSDPASPTCPSTEKQKNLGRLLASELQAMGLADAHLDEHGYVYATIPANTDKKVPVICFCSHMDTSPDCTGANVKPQIVKNYRGGDIVLPADPTQVIRAADHPGARRPDRPRHHHDRRHHAAGRRQQGRSRRDHGCGAVPDSTIPRSGTAPSRSCSRPTRRSAAASTRST